MRQFVGAAAHDGSLRRVSGDAPTRDGIRPGWRGQLLMAHHARPADVQPLTVSLEAERCCAHSESGTLRVNRWIRAGVQDPLRQSFIRSRLPSPLGNSPRGCCASPNFDYYTIVQAIQGAVHIGLAARALELRRRWTGQTAVVLRRAEG